MAKSEKDAHLLCEVERFSRLVEAESRYRERAMGRLLSESFRTTEHNLAGVRG